MKRTNVRKLTALFAVVALLAVSLSVISIEFVAHAKPDVGIPLRGANVPLLKSAHSLGAVDGKQPLKLSVALQWRNQGELDALLRNLYDPSSSQYHQFLTPDEFRAEFAPTADEQQQVVNYLRGLGFQVTSVSSNGLLVDATATEAQAEQGFKVHINNYQAGSHRFFANDRSPTIPSSLGSVILSISGLDNSVKLHPEYPLSASGKSSPRKQNANPTGYGPSDLAGAYDANPLKNANIQGSNQTVAVFELDGYKTSDVTNYFSFYGLGSPSITTVKVDGFLGLAGAGAIEAELDIEVVAAMAPKAAQIVYEGPNTTSGVNDTYNKIVTDNKAQVMTTSWGLCEAFSRNNELQTLDNIFKQGAAQGISMYAASGDSGAYDCSPSTLSVDSPASDPYVTGVGGTTLTLKGGSYGSESVWNNSYGSGGGGLSSFFAKPTWQTGPGVQNQYSNGKREVPDVSADADPNTGYAIYCTVSAAGCNSSGWIEVGGTSGAAPLWAGSTALINQYLLQQGKSRVGYVNPALYGLENAQQPSVPFHDVMSGNNEFYPATPNYDLATGWGSPDINNIALDLANGTNPGPTPTPSPTPNPGGSMIQNGGFENATTPWVEYSARGYKLIDSTNLHTGNYSAHLCGYSRCDDSIGQSFTVPTGNSTITLGYWWYGLTQHTTYTCVDTFAVILVDSNGHMIGRLQLACNYNATARWVHASFNVTNLLSRYGGKTVMLFFEARTSSSLRTTSIFVDDVAVTSSAPGTRPGGPPPVAPPGSSLPVEPKDG
jgi:Pro-kumamolisin, activation domain